MGFGKKVTAAALPLALPALFNKAYGQTAALDPLIVATLNLALQLEYLEKYSCQTALASNILSTEESAAISSILNDENPHINTLCGVLGTQAIADPTRAAFDYTGSQHKARAALFPTLGGTTAPTTGDFTSKTDFLMVGKYQHSEAKYVTNHRPFRRHGAAPAPAWQGTSPAAAG